jgi:hypothetical protein
MLILYPCAIILLLYRRLNPNHYIDFTIDTCLLSYLYLYTPTYSYDSLNQVDLNTTSLN